MTAQFQVSTTRRIRSATMAAAVTPASGTASRKD